MKRFGISRAQYYNVCADATTFAARHRAVKKTR